MTNFAANAEALPTSTRVGSVKITDSENMNTRQKCEIINLIRARVADANGIDFTVYECTFEGECPKDCQKSDSELRYLEGELERMQDNGERINLKGVFALEIDEAPEKHTETPSDRQEKIKKLMENPDLNGLPPRYLDSLLD